MSNWRPTAIHVRTLAAIETQQLSKADTACLALACQQQMQACLDELRGAI